jgi:hypothetical protein
VQHDPGLQDVDAIVVVAAAQRTCALERGAPGADLRPTSGSSGISSASAAPSRMASATSSSPRPS